MSHVVKVLKPAGILDGIRGHELRREVNNLVTNGTDIVLIDLEDIKFIDSSGLGALVSSVKIVRNAGSKLYVCSVNDQVRMLFELTKVDRIFKKFTDQEEFKRQVLEI